MFGIISDRKMLSSEGEKILRITSEADMARQANAKGLERSFMNLKAYSGLDGGAWEPHNLKLLADENRSAQIYNIIAPKIDVLTGSQIAETYDVDYKPVSGSPTQTTEAIKQTYYPDKELGNWDFHLAKTLRDGNIYNGVIKMEIDRSVNGLPYITFKHKNPGFIQFDPYWMTDDDNDCQMCWEYAHLSAIQIKNIFNKNGKIVEAAAKELKKNGGQWMDPDYDYRTTIEDDRKGHLYRVISKYWLEIVNIKRLYGRRIGAGDFARYIPFPITTDHEILEGFMMANSIDPLSMYDAPHFNRIQHVTTVCGALISDALLEDDKTETQCQRLSYFQYTYNRINGQNIGAVDAMLDPQRSIDKREAKLDDLINSANGGGEMVSKDLFKRPTDRQDYEENYNKPKVFWVEGEELRKGNNVQKIRPNDYPAQIVNGLERMYDIPNRTTNITAAMQSMTETKSEPGVVLDRKLQVSKIGLLLNSSRKTQLLNNMGQAYFYQWKITYKGLKRDFSTKNGKYKITLNKEAIINNRRYLMNRPDDAPRCTVIITETNKSPTQQAANRQVYAEMYKNTAQTNPEYATMFLRMTMETYDLTDEQKQELESIKQLQKVRDNAKLINDIANLDSGTTQAIAMKMQAMQAMESLNGGQIPQETPPPQMIPEDELEISTVEQEQLAEPAMEPAMT